MPSSPAVANNVTEITDNITGDSKDTTEANPQSSVKGEEFHSENGNQNLSSISTDDNSTKTTDNTLVSTTTEILPDLDNHQNSSARSSSVDGLPLDIFQSSALSPSNLFLLLSSKKNSTSDVNEETSAGSDNATSVNIKVPVVRTCSTDTSSGNSGSNRTSSQSGTSESDTTKTSSFGVSKTSSVAMQEKEKEAPGCLNGKKVAPYGSWSSPVTSELVVKATDVIVDGPKIDPVTGKCALKF